MIGTKSNNTSNRVFLRSFNLLHVFAKPIIARIIKIFHNQLTAMRTTDTKRNITANAKNIISSTMNTLNSSCPNTFKNNPEYYFGLYDYVYTKNKSIYQENFPNPILAYQENEALRQFNSKVKNTFFFRLYTIFKRIIKK